MFVLLLGAVGFMDLQRLHNRIRHLPHHWAELSVEHRAPAPSKLTSMPHAGKPTAMPLNSLVVYARFPNLANGFGWH